MNAYTRELKEARKRANRGAAWLDEFFPGWEARINVDTLSLANGSKCICGQVFERAAKTEDRYGDGFTYAYAHLFEEARVWLAPQIRLRGYGQLDQVAAYLGFRSDNDTRFFHPSIGYTALNIVWKQILRDRAAAKAPDEIEIPVESVIEEAQSILEMTHAN